MFKHYGIRFQSRCSVTVVIIYNTGNLSISAAYRQFIRSAMFFYTPYSKNKNPNMCQHSYSRSPICTCITNTAIHPDRDQLCCLFWSLYAVGVYVRQWRG